MRLIRQRPPPLPLQLPRLDGSTWPDRRAIGRASFEVSTLYEMGYREGFEPPAHAIADGLLVELLPRIPVGDVLPEDFPYLRRTLQVAAQMGAGIGIVEARTLATASESSDRRIWGALWRALRDLPEMPPQQRFGAAYLMQSGYYVARTDSGVIPRLAAALRAELGAGSS
jgi:hypothetical protein